MATILLPLASHPDAADDLRESLCTAASLLVAGSDEPGEAGSGPGSGFAANPLRIVLPAGHEWDGAEYDALHKRGIILSPDSDATDETGVLLRAFEETLRRTGRDGRQDEDEFGAAGLVCIVPVLVVLASEEGDAAAFGDMTRFWRDLDVVWKHLAARGGRDALAQAQFRCLPWIFSEKAPDSDQLEQLIARSRDLRLRAVPVLHSGQSRGNLLQHWSTHGTRRLISDTLGIHTLSSDGDLFKSVFDETTQGNLVCYNLNTSFFEYPLRSLRYQAMTERLRATENQQGILPPLGGMEDVINRLQGLVQVRHDQRVDKVRQVLADAELDPRTFWFGPDRQERDVSIRHHQAPDFDFDNDDVLGRALAHKDSGSLMTARANDQLHTRFMNSLEACTQDGAIDDVLGRALEEANKHIKTEMAQIETELLMCFKERVKGEEGPDSPAADMSLPCRATGMTLGLIDGIINGLERLGREIQDEDADLAPVLLQGRNLRQGWIAEEADLLRRGQDVPTIQAVTIETIGAALGGAALVICLAFLRHPLGDWPRVSTVLASLALGAVTGGLVFQWRRRQVRDYVRQWREFGDRLMGQANGVMTELTTRINHRIRYVMYTATGDLRRALSTTRLRFLTEVQGFVSLVDDELAMITRARNDSPDPEVDEQAGWFRVRIDHSPRVNLSADDVHARLVTLLRDALKLDCLPRRLPISDHHALLQELARHCLGTSTDQDSRIREEARQFYRDALQYARRERNLSELGTFETVRETDTFVLRGTGIDASLGETAVKTALDGIQDADHGVTDREIAGLPSEIAICMRAEHCSVERDPERGAS